MPSANIKRTYPSIDRNGDPVDLTLWQDGNGNNHSSGALVNRYGENISPATQEDIQTLQARMEQGLPFNINKTVYTVSTSNNSTAQLAVGATFTGGIESSFDIPSIQVLIRLSNVAYTVNILQYIDAAGAQLIDTKTFKRVAGQPTCENIQLAGNYFRVTVTNNGASATTDFVLQTTIGNLSMSPKGLTDKGNMPVGNFGQVGRLLSSQTLEIDGTEDYTRVNQYGEFIPAPSGQIQFGLEGSYFVGGTTIGTAVALTTATQTAFANTAPAIVIRNTNAAGGKDLIVKRITLITNTVGAGLTALDGAVLLGALSNYTSGGTSVTMKDLRTITTSAMGVLYAGASAIVSTAPSLVVSRCKIRTGIPVIGDVYKLNFGGEPTTETGLLSGTAASLFAHNLPPLIIPPQSAGFIYL